jgi:hypothetical protein
MLLTTIAGGAASGALAHGPGAAGHAHPHGLEIVLLAFAVGAAACLAASAFRMLRRRPRGRR